jgi:hypothetical protein
METPNHYDLELQTLQEESVGRLLRADVFDKQAFLELIDYLDEKSKSLQSEYSISKQILACLRDAEKSIHSRAEYIPEVKANLNMANEFSLLLDLMIANETLSEWRSQGPLVK